MSNEFKREERYIVVKIKDAQAIDSNDPFNGEHALRDFLKQWHIPTREAVVVEKDWPEFEPTWAAIERRVTGSVQWDGEGLPPVGTVCEIGKDRRHHAAYAYHAGKTANIIAHETTRCGSPCAVYWVLDDDGFKHYHALSADPGNFVPIPTPEQIAEAAKQEAIAQLIADTGGELGPSGASLLYSLGYRKQVTQ